MKELRMVNGDVIDADKIQAWRDSDTDEWTPLEALDHRLANADPEQPPADAPRDDNDDPVFNDR